MKEIFFIEPDGSLVKGVKWLVNIKQRGGMGETGAER
jgi:hypothetical protein